MERPDPVPRVPGLLPLSVPGGGVHGLRPAALPQAVREVLPLLQEADPGHNQRARGQTVLSTLLREYIHATGIRGVNKSTVQYSTVQYSTAQYRTVQIFISTFHA